MKRKSTKILFLLFLLICVLFGAVVIKNKEYNSHEHKLEFNEKILKAGEVKDDHIMVQISPRGYETDEYGAWYHSYHLPGENPESEPHHAVGTIQEMRITNLTDETVADWSARIYFQKKAMFNSGWNGDFILHQYADEDEAVFTFKDSKFIVENITLDYSYDQSVLLMPVHAGDYFDYIPSASSHEVPLENSNTRTETFTERIIGFIVYVENANIANVDIFSKGYITYKMHRSIWKEPLFYVAAIALWLWLMSLVILFFVHRNIAKMQKENKIKEELIHKFEMDPLTNVYTRQAFFHYADKLFEEPDKEFGVAIVSIDNYNITRNQYGESICEQFNLYLADYLRHLVTNGFVGRISRSKYAIISEIDDIDKINPEMVIDAEMIKKSPMPNQVLKIGVYMPVDKTITIRRCCDRVLLALSKISGIYGQNISYYDDVLESQLMDDHKIQEYMEEALKEKQFKVYYQPKNDASTGKIVGAEALVRWIHPEYGFMSPGQFIPIFENTGFITKLDAYVFERVCSDIKEWADNGQNVVPVSVNVSRKDFYEDNWFEQRLECLEKIGIDINNIHLEVTESLYAEDVDSISQRIKWLQDKGFKIELDDFGSGYSSLGMLTTLSIDVIKLDMSFMKDIVDNDVVVDSIIALSHKLGLTTIAEGVETKEQREIISKLGCDNIQGYFFSKPLPREEFEEYVKNNF